jgi:hypothetical protein
MAKNLFSFGERGITMKTRLQRFWDKVDVSLETDCWLWTGHNETMGYGRFWDGKKNKMAHRWAYEYSIGPIPL